MSEESDSLVPEYNTQDVPPAGPPPVTWSANAVVADPRVQADVQPVPNPNAVGFHTAIPTSLNSSLIPKTHMLISIL